MDRIARVWSAWKSLWNTSGIHDESGNTMEDAIGVMVEEVLLVVESVDMMLLKQG